MPVVDTDDAAADVKDASGGDSSEKLATFVFGVVFLATMLGLAVWVPNPSESQWFVFRVVLAAAAGGFVVFLPGAVNVSIKPTLRAGGALGVFALVYAVNPPKTSETPVQAPPPNRYNLELKLTFSPDDRRDLDPFGANVKAFVNNAVTLVDYPGSDDPKLHSNFVRRGQGGIALTLSDLSAGDKLSVLVDQGDRYWRSDEMKMPEANLEMNATPTPPSTGGQR